MCAHNLNSLYQLASYLTGPVIEENLRGMLRKKSVIGGVPCKAVNESCNAVLNLQPWKVREVTFIEQQGPIFAARLVLACFASAWKLTFALTI